MCVNVHYVVGTSETRRLVETVPSFCLMRENSDPDLSLQTS